MAKQESVGTWKGRRPKGERDNNSWQSFLSKTNKRMLREHLARHHRGIRI